jgi:hypothetical protein
LGEVNRPRFVADSELAAEIRGAQKLSVRPDALPCPKTWGMMDGAGEQIKTGAGKNGVRTKSGFQPSGTGRGG